MTDRERALEEALTALLPTCGWRNLSDDELRWEEQQGNGIAPLLLAARAALATKPMPEDDPAWLKRQMRSSP
jgi:hypothetical protein